MLIRRNQYTKKYMQYSGGFSIYQWMKRLAMAPKDVVRETFESTTYLAENVPVENMMVPRQHKKTRFPFLRENRVNDEFHSDTFSLQFNQIKDIHVVKCS